VAQKLGIERLPDINRRRTVSQAIATLDAELPPEWEFRYYSYNSKWDVGEEMASMRDGSGSFYFILFSRDRAIIKGFDIDSEMGRFNRKLGHPFPGVLDEVPSSFGDSLAEPAFHVGEATFCTWRTTTDPDWQSGHFVPPKGTDPDTEPSLMNGGD